MGRLSSIILAGAVASLLSATAAFPSDWPTWRHDATRTAATDEELAPKLFLQWVREYPPVLPTWPDEPRVLFDATYEPVVSGKTMFVALSGSDKVVALDTATGAEKWSFFAEGPVRFAPVVHGDKVLFGSDDGLLYCLDAATGGLVWKFRGGPDDRRLLGHDRLISLRPVGGGPVVADGKVYFAAGVWPFMGIFVHALDADTGEVLWTNDESSFLYLAIPHGHSDAYSFSGPTPQGYMVAVGDKLLVPCGRSLPACYDRVTGKLIYYKPTEGEIYGNPAACINSVVSAVGNYFFTGKGIFDVATSRQLGELAPASVLTPDVLYAGQAAYDLTKVQLGETAFLAGEKRSTFTAPKLFSLPPGSYRMKAGKRLYGDAPGKVFALDLPAPGEQPKVSWTAAVKGTPRAMLAADGRLYVVTREGSICCFGPNETEAKTWTVKPEPLPAETDDWTRKVNELLKQAGTRDGYCVVLGVESARLLEELLQQSQFHVIAVDSDSEKADSLRRRFDLAGLYGRRIEVHVGDPANYPLPPFLASFIFADESILRDNVFATLRPYGGVAYFGLAPGRQSSIPPVVRTGALPGSADWTHDNADAGRTVTSKDKLVKAPLGVLWFGGQAGSDIFLNPGWLGGPGPLVIDGRMILQGPGALYAVDVYTGRIMWKTLIETPKGPYATRLTYSGPAHYAHNCVATHEAVYLAHEDRCLVIDPATGMITAQWKLPADDEGRAPYWGNMLAVDDVLIAASCAPVDLARLPADESKLTARQIVRLCEWVDALSMEGVKAITMPKAAKPADFMHETIGKLLGEGPLAVKFPKLRSSPAVMSMESAERIVAFDRKTGKQLWAYSFAWGVQHNHALVGGGGKVFCIDALPAETADVLKRRGKLPDDYAPRLLAFDLHTGSIRWSVDKDVFGGLSYAASKDLVLQAGGPGVSLRIARNAADGALVWKSRMEAEGYGRWHPSIIRSDTIVNHLGAVFDLATGSRRTIEHPLTGQPVPWTAFTRTHGCNHPVASEGLILVRTGTPAFVDLSNFSGTYSLGGFRSACQNNLIAADGVLSVPRYSGCHCAYPITTSLALVHMPDAEMWSCFGDFPVRGRVKRVGLNLGAPGDRRADDGTLWLDYPSVGGPSPDIPVKVAPEKVEWFRHHSTWVQGEGLKWVAASGCKGLTSLVATLAAGAQEEKPYTVRLHFIEPDGLKPGERVFSVALQGREALKDLDIAAEAGGSKRPLVREFRGIIVKDELTITVTAKAGAPVLCGVEIVAEGW